MRKCPICGQEYSSPPAVSRIDTPYEELRAFIQQELGELFEEVQPE